MPKSAMEGSDCRKRESKLENSAAAPKRNKQQNKVAAGGIAEKSSLSGTDKASNSKQDLENEPTIIPSGKQKTIQVKKAKEKGNYVPVQANMSSSSLDTQNSGPSRSHKIRNLMQLVSPQSDMCVGDCLITLSKLTKMYNLPDTCSEKLVQLITAMAPESAIDPNFDLLQSVDLSLNVLPPPRVHTLCATCENPVGDQGLCCTSFKFAESANHILGVENDLSAVIKDLFEKQGLAYHMELTDQSKDTDGYMTDISSGVRFSILPKESEYDISFILSASFETELAEEGEQPYSCFTTVLSIAELKPSLRNKLLILGNIWLVPGEQPKKVILTRFSSIMEHLSTRGVDWIHPKTKAKMNSKAFLLCCSVGNEMRNFMQNLVPLGQEHCCSFCEQPTFEDAPDFDLDKKWKLRSHANVTKNAFQASFVCVKGKVETEKGVLGVSPLTFIPNFDIVNGFSAEYTENLLLVVVRHILHMCLTREDKPYHLAENNKSVIQLKLAIISSQRPSFLDKPHASLANYLTWTANEWRNWLLFYSVPCLKDLWPDEFLEHHCFLVRGVYNLLKDEISHEDLEQSKTLLSKYCRRSKELYGEVGFDLHLLLHIVQNVQQCGPLWSSSAFPFQWVHDFVLCKVSDLDKTVLTVTDVNKISEDLNNLTSLQYMRNVKQSEKEFIPTGEALKLSTLTKKDAEKLNQVEVDHLKDTIFYRAGLVNGFHLESHLLQNSGLVRNSIFLIKKMRCGVANYSAVRLICFFEANNGDALFFGNKIKLLDPIFETDAVILDHIKTYKLTDITITGAVRKIKCPLILVDNVLCIPPNIKELKSECQ